jgi:tetratricopeptide (TPR) repeat protein
MQNLATGYRAMGRFREADALFTEVLGIRQRALGNDHWMTQNTRLSLAISYRAQGRFDEAEPLFVAALAQLQRVLPPDHSLTLQARYHLGELYRRQRRYGEAETLLSAVIDPLRRKVGTDSPYTADAQASLGQVWLEQRKYAEAEPPLREALRIWEKSDPNGWRCGYGQMLLAVDFAGLGRGADAEKLERAGYEALAGHRDAVPAEYVASLDDVRRRFEALEQRQKKF